MWRFESLNMSEVRRQKILVEIIWWIATILLIIFILKPIYDYVPAYPFFWQNAMLIAAFVTFTRYIFHLRLSLIAKAKWIKVFIIGAAAIMFFIMTMAFGDFRNYLDEEGLQVLVDHLPFKDQTRIMSYIKSQMVFFSVGAIIAGLILPLRMIISLWRMRNRGTV